MKNFKYRLELIGNRELFEQIVPKLNELDYDVPSKNRFTDTQRSLVTDSGGTKGEVYMFRNIDPRYPRFTTDNPDLFLALAAMVDEDRFYVGESIVAEDSLTLKNGKLYVISDTDGCHIDVKGLEMRYVTEKQFVRKATKEEIINHFTNMQTPNSLVNMTYNNAAIASALEEEFGNDTALVTVSELRGIYNAPTIDAAREAIEEALPTLFPRPTFSIGERIVLLPHTTELMIVGGTRNGRTRIAVVSMENGQVASETVEVIDPDRITEKELFAAGKGFDLNRTNYAKYCAC